MSEHGTENAGSNPRTVTRYYGARMAADDPNNTEHSGVPGSYVLADRIQVFQVPLQSVEATPVIDTRSGITLVAADSGSGAFSGDNRDTEPSLRNRADTDVPTGSHPAMSKAGITHPGVSQVSISAEEWRRVGKAARFCALAILALIGLAGPANCIVDATSDNDDQKRIVEDADGDK